MNLQAFYKRYGRDTTTNFQLIKYAKELKIPNFHVCMRDEVKQLPRDKCPLNVITNIHTSDERGVHWSALHVSKGKGPPTGCSVAYFFDSFGLPPTQEIINFLSKVADRTCNTLQVQESNTSYCGQLCLFVLYRFTSGSPFEDVIISLL